MRASDVSGVVVSFQAVGTLLLALIIAQLGRIFVFRYARMWALGWASISIGLLAVRLYIQTLSRTLWFVYLMGEWLFIALICIGCYELSRGIRLDKRRLMVVAGIALALAVILPVSVPKFNV